MKKLFLYVFLGLLWCNFSLANSEMEEIILDELRTQGKKVCNEEGFGEHYLEGNPLTFVDISNDGIIDIILDEKKQRCETIASFFAGGTGGNDYIFFINPTLDIVKNWNSAEFLRDDKEKRIFTLLIRDYEIVEWNNKNALKISTHGISCDVDGARGCYSILLASESGIENVDGPYPNNIKRPILKCSYVAAGESYSVVHDFNQFDAYPVYEMTNSEIKWENFVLQNGKQFYLKSKFNRTTGLIETEVTQKGESKGTTSGMCDKEVAHVDTATEETEESTLYLANGDLIIEYNKKLLNKKLSIKEIVKICKEYESKNINAAEYDQMTLNTDIGIHSYCTTTKMRNEFKQESKYNLVKDLDIEKFNFNYFTNEDYTISIPVSEITKSSSCFVNLKEEKSISYFEIKERCGVKKFITKELSNVCPATGCVLSTYEWTEDSELKNHRIRIIDYFYADANKDDYMDLIIRLKPVGGGSMGENTETIVVTSLSKGEFININYKK